MKRSDRQCRIAASFAGREYVAIGLRRQWWNDLYHRLLTTPWQGLFALVLGVYLAANALFAVGYLALGDAIESAERGSFRDAFFFSVQTMATIGYGKMAPRTTGANVIVTVEALVGLLGLALVTGLVFAKFSRPTARIVFSRAAVVTVFEGVPALLFRMANARANQVAEAQLRLSLIRDERTAEGEPLRRQHDLALRRSQTPVFALTWTAVHPITPGSPLHGETAGSMREKDADLVVSFVGHDEAFSQTIHARHTYRPEHLVWGGRFRDMFTRLPDGRRAIDYRVFDEVVAPEPGAPGEPERAAGGPPGRP